MFAEALFAVDRAPFGSHNLRAAHRSQALDGCLAGLGAGKALPEIRAYFLSSRGISLTKVLRDSYLVRVEASRLHNLRLASSKTI